MNSIFQGFERVYDFMPEIAIDIPQQSAITIGIFFHVLFMTSPEVPYELL